MWKTISRRRGRYWSGDLEDIEEYSNEHPICVTIVCIVLAFVRKKKRSVENWRSSEKTFRISVVKSEDKIPYMYTLTYRGGSLCRVAFAYNYGKLGRHSEADTWARFLLVSSTYWKNGVRYSRRNTFRFDFYWMTWGRVYGAVRCLRNRGKFRRRRSQKKIRKELVSFFPYTQRRSLHE